MELKEYFQQPFQGGDSFLQQVVFPIFGEETFEDGFNTPLLDENPELGTIAKSTGIKSICRVGTIQVEFNPIDIFDITVTDHVQMARNRVAIQQLIRRIMNTYSCAFMIFHYEDTSNWDWRFTFCSKRGNNEETTDSKRYTFLLGPNQSCRTAAENFRKLMHKQGKIELRDIENAFNVEALSKEFFGKYKQQYEAFVNYIANPDNGMRQNYIDTDFDHTGMTAEKIRDREEKTIRDHVKKLLGRIVFLHFLQKKGWLGVPANEDWGNGDRDFMLHLFEKATETQKANFLNEILEPLFTDALDNNRSNKNDNFDTGINEFRNIRIPYLNGGLFECDGLDKKPSHFPPEYFRSLLTMLSQYNFTIDENDPNDAEVGVDPEMLGRIFENLLEDNKDKGAFYTPKEIVQYMCRESLIAYLQTDQAEADKGQIRLFVITHDVNYLGSLVSDIEKKLRNVKICDPAIGSGAFPMGLLRELFFCRSAIEPNIVENAANIKRHIIQNNIYGVDIERGAVEIARLRFWLSLIVDEKSPITLPNLDFKIMQGNSLLESFEGFDLCDIAEDGSRTGQIIFDDDSCNRALIQEHIRKYFEQDNHNERRLLREKIDQAVKNLIIANNPSIKQKVGELDLQNNSNFFLWHTYFKDVFSRPSKEGFDIVIGNPPYIEAKKLKYIASSLKGLYEIYSGTADLSIYFNELGLNILANGGILSFITTNKFFNTGYGEKVRKQIAMQKINMLLNFEQVEVFEDVLVSSVIFNVAKQPKKQGNLFTYEKFYQLKCTEFKRQFVERQQTFGSYSQDYLNEREWSFANMKQLLLKEKIEQGCTLLKNVDGVKIYRGVTTGYNPAFIISDQQRDELLIEGDNNTRIIKNLLQGRNIKRWYYNESEENLIFTRKGIDIERYPAVKRHLSDFYNKLKPKSSEDSVEGRKPGKYKWFEILDNTTYYPEFEKPEKIIWGLTADKWAFTLDTKSHYLPSNAYILTSAKVPIRFLLGLLNSRLLHYYFGFIGVMTAGGAYTLKAATIEVLPIPYATAEQQQKVASLADNILKAKAKDKQTDVSVEEGKIDNLVYKLYGLTPTEVKILEGD